MNVYRLRRGILVGAGMLLLGVLFAVVMDWWLIAFVAVTCGTILAVSGMIGLMELRRNR